MSGTERVLWGTLLALATVVGFILWASGYWSAFVGQVGSLVSSPPAKTPLGSGSGRPAGAKGGP